MRIDVLLFGPQARAAGRERATVEVVTPATVGAVLIALKAQVPAIAPTIASSRLAINHAFARADQSVAPADEIALIGPVSGG